ncbi:VacJ family lipoprotein [Methylophaga sp. OBS1]|uniref:MlaA family lipoprotein n=1 Tax=Methylophaga sp. OBS1 TaxID=2991933 RepID=UPI0022576FF8|nr:VacJ family lipoprotein [Methylophaga sp. OBS1]MCX4193673.1 VacJ family lipoprotein [Methylophaga sp. OBS1]
MTHLRTVFRLGIAVMVLFMTGCATTNQSASAGDPLEGYNRAMYKFNDAVDTAVLKPVARGYDAVVPDPISQGVSNFFSNLNDITVIINDLFQGKFYQAYRDTHRFVLNTTVGVAGIFDVASLSGFTKNNEDFGQTLGVWGAEPGAYVVLPFFGPRNVRDTFGLIGDMFTDPVMYVEGDDARIALVGTRVVDTRANLLKAEKVLDQAATDEYSYVRDAYMSRRQYLVFDGNPPMNDEFDVFEDD